MKTHSKDAYREQELESLVLALWSFIENGDDMPQAGKIAQFFKLRERVRSI